MDIRSGYQFGKSVLARPGSFLPGLVLASSFLSGLVLPGLVEASGPPVVQLPTYPIVADFVYTGGAASSYAITLSGVGSGYDVGDGTYRGWCVEDNGQPDYFIDYLFSSYDPAMPQGLRTYQDPTIPRVQNGTSLMGDAIPWDKVNYLLNHKQGDMYDIQAAMWQLVWGSSSTFPLTSLAASMALEAETFGGGFVPAAGQTLGVLLYVDGIGPSGWQDAMIELPAPGTPGCDDFDGDGFTSCGGDCDDQSSDVNPAHPEECDLKDNDCDGQIDEGLAPDGGSTFVTSYSDGSGSLSTINSDSGATSPLTGPGGPITLGVSGATSIAVGSDGLFYVVTGEGDDSLYSVNSGTGVVIKIGPLSHDASNVQGMDFAPNTSATHGFVPGMLYAVSIDGFGSFGPNVLFSINPSTGEATALAGLAGNQIRGVSFNPITGELWVYDPGGKNLYTVKPDGTLTYKFTIPDSHHDGKTGVDTVFSLAHGCDGELYAVDIAYGVLLWIDLVTKQAYWVGSYGSAASASSSFQANGLDILNGEGCGCLVGGSGSGIGGASDPIVATDPGTSGSDAAATPTDTGTSDVLVPPVSGDVAAANTENSATEDSATEDSATATDAKASGRPGLRSLLEAASCSMTGSGNSSSGSSFAALLAIVALAATRRRR